MSGMKLPEGVGKITLAEALARYEQFALPNGVELSPIIGKPRPLTELFAGIKARVTPIDADIKADVTAIDTQPARPMMALFAGRSNASALQALQLNR